MKLKNSLIVLIVTSLILSGCAQTSYHTTKMGAPIGEATSNGGATAKDVGHFALGTVVGFPLPLLAVLGLALLTGI